MGARRTSCPLLIILSLWAILLAAGCSTSDRRGSDVFQRDLPKAPRSAASSAARAASGADAPSPAQPEPVPQADQASPPAEADASSQRSGGEAPGVGVDVPRVGASATPGLAARSAAEQAQLLTAALEQLNEPDPGLAAPAPGSSAVPSTVPMEQPTRTPEGAPQPNPVTLVLRDPQQPGSDPGLPPPPESEPASPEPTQADSTAAASPTSTRQALLAQLRESIRSSDQPVADKALALAALGLLDGTAPDQADLASLPAPQRDRLASFQSLIRQLAERWSSSSSTPDPQAVVDQLSHLLGPQPLTIRQAKLCLSVKGFGVYDELPSPSLQAGREHRLVVYVELDHFEAAPTSGLFQVKLSQETEVYTEADGLCVWRLPKAEFVDESRNRRRDFFTTQLVRLPPNLGVGRYRLKVRLTDLANNSCDEVSIPFQVVADPTIATGG